jgi:hypothetical protein
VVFPNSSIRVVPSTSPLDEAFKAEPDICQSPILPPVNFTFDPVISPDDDRCNPLALIAVLVISKPAIFAEPVEKSTT